MTTQEKPNAHPILAENVFQQTLVDAENRGKSFAWAENVK